MFDVKARALTALLSGLGLCLSAQDCHIALRGRITEAETGEPLPFASVVVKEVGKGAVADENGRYLIADLCEGVAYTVDVSHVECAHQTQVVRLIENTEVDFNLLHSAVLSEILVSERAVAARPVQAASEVDKTDLEAGKAVNLGETLKKLPGVAILNTGATIAKPVIQGLHSNRIAIVNNNVVLEGQQWGSEHAPEIDPFSADRITVVKGAAGVRYGPGAMGGAVVLEPAPLPDKAGLGGWLSAGASSNGRGGVVSGALETFLPAAALGLRLQGTVKRSGTLRAPRYWLGNTAMAEYDASMLASWKHGNWRHEWSLSTFNQHIGILRAAHIGNLTDLAYAVQSDTPRNNINAFSYRIGRPYQLVRHQLFKYRSELRLTEKWKLSGQYAFQYNNRREYDAHPPLSDPDDLLKKPQISFRIWTNTLGAAIEHFPIRHWEGALGVQAQQQLNYVGKGGYIPDYLSFGGAVWALERWRRYPTPWEFEAGVRYDYRWSHVTDTLSFSRQVDTVVHFGNLSGTLGAVYHITPRLTATLNTGLAWRPPHVNELFARGVHHGAGTFEQGNPNLHAEEAWNSNLSIEWQQERLQWGLTLFHNRIGHFIYLNPQTEPVLTVRGAFPAYHYEQANAVLQGFDARFSVPVWRTLQAEGKVSIFRGFKTGGERDTSWLPLMPPDRFQYGLKWNFRSGQPDAGFIRLLATTALQQTRISNNERASAERPYIKAAPPGFTIFSLEIAHTLTLHNQTLELGLNIQNLSNAIYREYLNFFRLYADEAGFNAALRAKWKF